MEQISYLKKFAYYASLSVLGTLGVSCYILADTFFVAAGLGTAGLAALNIAIPAFNFIHGSGLMLGMGGATKFSISKCGWDEEHTAQIFPAILRVSLLLGLLFAAVGLFAAGPLALLLGADTSVLAMTETYLKWLLLFSPAFILNDVLLCFVRNDSSPGLAMAAMLIGSFSNIVLDYIFIFPMGLGIFGAVFATGLSPIISMAVISLHWLKKENSLRFGRAALDPDLIFQSLSLGFPSLIAQVASGLAMIVFNILIMKLEGSVGVAAYGVTANISLVVLAVYTGLSQGAQPLLSEACGRGDREHIRLGLRYAMLTMLIFSALIYLCIFLFAEPITALFNSENNVRMQAISVTGLRLYFTAAVFAGYNTVLAVYFTSIDRAMPAHILSLLRGIVLLLPLAFLLSSLWGMTGIWLTFPITEALTAALGYGVYRRQNLR